MDPTNFAALSATSVPVHARPGRADSRSGHVGFRGVADINQETVLLAAQVRPKICHRRIIRAPPSPLPFSLPAGLMLAIRCAVAASMRFIGTLAPYLCNIRDVVCPSGSVMKLIWASL